MRGNSKALAHGEYKLTFTDNVFCIIAKGAWNVEAIQSVHQDIIKILAGKNINAFSVCIEVSEFELGTPEFQSFGTDSLKSLARLGLKKIAYVNESRSAVSNTQIAKLNSESSKYEWGLFKSVAEARKWLA